MKKNKKTLFVKTKMGLENVHEDSTEAIRVLESAWNNLPGDISMEEREIFYELSAQIIKLHHKMNKLYQEEFSDKN